MSRAILIVSGKGGVGKTTLTSNLAASLQKIGYETVAIDANFTTPHLGMHLGMHLTDKNLHDVLKGREKVENVLYPHPFGFKIIPGSISMNSMKNANYKRLSSIVLKLLSQFDFILIDSAAGLGEETMAALESVSEVLIVTNPDLPSVTDALKTVRHAQKKRKKVLGAVVNRVKKSQHELSGDLISEMLGVPVISLVPEDSIVSRSIDRKVPAVHLDSDSIASREIRKVAHMIAERHFYEDEPNDSSLKRFFKWFGVFMLIPATS